MAVRNRRALEAGRLLAEGSPALERARARLHEPHVAPLTDLVGQVRARTGEHVPDVDPGGGGVRARVLLLRQDPFCSARDGARLVSPYADDATSAGVLRACEAAGLPDGDVLLWNVVPWWVHDPDRVPPGRRTRARPAEARRAAPWLRALLDLLPRLDTVVLLGRDAQAEWGVATGGTEGVTAGPDGATPGGTLRVLRCPSPSPMSLHGRDAAGRSHRELVSQAFAAAAAPPGAPEGAPGGPGV
ncbi:uracil-DNA glycosylase family protein [Aquipuribacter hungaricus]|uniref:Uracil-DNA glycosylase family protein n=1 Tax=Aquipuribacter hungaricus TaxID=545624 RepID=A0ABV7WJ97_9MICO